MRKDWQKIEAQILSVYASQSAASKGRIIDEELCPIRTIYQQDRDRIIHCKAFRRLKHKTQVFVNPIGDHFRTRMTHTFEVSQISRTIARALRLNEDLTEAIALGHDLGHTPFGHAGERALANILGEFRHNLQSIRVVQKIERAGKGLNLSIEVLDGIKNHSGQNIAATLEGNVVRIADRIAYLNHDLDDALRANIIKDIPKQAIIIGQSHSERIHNLVLDIIKNGLNQPQIKMSDLMAAKMDDLRQHLFATVYMRPEAKEEEEILHQKIEVLFRHYLQNIDELPAEYYDNNHQLAIADYIAGMTDTYALSEYARITKTK